MSNVSTYAGLSEQHGQVYKVMFLLYHKPANTLRSKLCSLHPRTRLPWRTNVGPCVVTTTKPTITLCQVQRPGGRTIILKSTNASCDLDPFPTRLLKHYIDEVIVPITAIINLSMREGVVPPDFKQALVTPLIKKKTLCRN